MTRDAAGKSTVSSHRCEWPETCRNVGGNAWLSHRYTTSTRGIAYGQMEKPDDPDELIMFRNLLEQMLDGSYWS